MSPVASPLQIESRVSLREHNSFGLPAVARTLVRVRSEADVRRVVDHPEFGRAPKLILGGGSNLVLTRDVDAVVLKIEIEGRRLVAETDDAWIVEAGAGERWHDLVAWTLEQGLPGLENLALIPGTVGAAPVQNIGAYGIELKDRFHSLDAVDLVTGRSVTLDAAMCRFGYRDSVFKQALAGKSVVTRVRLRLPKPWVPALGYLDLERKIAETGNTHPDARTIFDWVCAIRRAKLPDPAAIGNAGSFFKNPVVSAEQCRDIIDRDPEIVHYPLPDGSVKLAAGWLIDACGWKGKSVGRAGVYERQALVLVNRGGASGAEVVTLARAIQESVYGRFGIRLEPEPVIV
ncbi:MULTISPECIES: UDP-N-acetylmuramate dehydrogenase [unclassified Rubrivivax]|uniref:UDP-N-acetylmuramate dehydrogenase n=1 Tax=unclassified Rubrivivax TaxID=2649762 RepID=UPI001E351DEF|nr:MULTISPECIES: UDP-N-acetylmuramate dehydrogenase [unclassified Rubrivivax]MCC9595906.1 UDP-N-acetylmuramate dehydrogenase [Rubrivivax sp. JA1055]MCC9647753.1 UDP-N-acetylmuramate dehydrogenase [Rubrivivax sp. JA1029]MCD0418159.1 UDP-N-acetylmuramate dehydrogenase [Rubrivivax sp. JA1024]